MSYKRPSLKELIDRIQADLIAHLEIQTAVLRRAFVRVIARVMAAAVYLLYGYIDWILKQLFPDTSEKEYLERQAYIFGVSRKAAAFAEGEVIFTGQDGAIIPKSTTIQRDDSIKYETDEEISISNKEAHIPVICKSFGDIGNCEANTTLTLVSPIEEINSECTVSKKGITSGKDEESDDSLRKRLLGRIRNPPHGGSYNDYLAWTLEVPGVTRAWIFPSRMGVGTIGITFVMDGNDNIIPDNKAIQLVQDYIDEKRPVTAEVFVFKPIPVKIDFKIKVKPNNQIVHIAIEANLRDLLGREAEPEGTIFLSHLREAISKSPHEVDHTLLYPTTDIVLKTAQIAVIGKIEWI